MEIQSEITAILTSLALTAVFIIFIWIYRLYQSKKTTLETEDEPKV